MVLGDLNVDLLNNNCRLTDTFKSILASFNMIQVVDQPTRITDQSATLIDVICMNNNLSFSGSNIIDMSDITDHKLVYCYVDLSPKKSLANPIWCRNFRNIDQDAFSMDARNINWLRSVDKANTNDKLKCISSDIISLFDSHAPMHMLRIETIKPEWLTETVQLMIKLREKAYNKFAKTKKANHFAYYKELRNLVSQAIKNEKKPSTNTKLKLAIRTLRNCGNSSNVEIFIANPSTKQIWTMLMSMN